MGHGDQGLDAVFMQLIKDTVIECQPLLVGGFLITSWENPGPGNGHAEHLKAHLGHQRNIFFIVMVEIRTMALGIVGGILCADGLLNVRRCDFPLLLHILHIHIRLKTGYISSGQALAAFVPAAFKLVGGSCAAP